VFLSFEFEAVDGGAGSRERATRAAVAVPQGLMWSNTLMVVLLIALLTWTFFLDPTLMWSVLTALGMRQLVA
jgi:hypothetical protein